MFKYICTTEYFTEAILIKYLSTNSNAPYEIELATQSPNR